MTILKKINLHTEDRNPRFNKEKLQGHKWIINGYEVYRISSMTGKKRWEIHFETHDTKFLQFFFLKKSILEYSF